MVHQKINPISAKKRIQSIDIIRGIAILGIFLVNMPSFNYPILYAEPGTNGSTMLDNFAEGFIDIAAQASFYTLFSFLFGFGMTIFQLRVIERGLSVRKLILKRLLFLFIIGCIHAFVIWHGDILISYAVVGVIFLLFHKMKPKTLIITAFLLIFVPNVLLAGLLYVASLVDPNLASFPTNAELVKQSFQIYGSGSFLEIMAQRVHDWAYVNNLGNGVFLLLSLLPMFLLGAAIAKNKWFERCEEHVSSLKKLWFFSLLIGVPMKILPYITHGNLTAEHLQDSIGGPLTSVFYATTIVLLTRKVGWKKALTPFAAIGRLSLSNYLFQSIFCTLLFYSYGLGYYGKVRPFLGLMLTIAIFILQLLISHLWLTKFRYGFVEWIWRIFTYGTRQPIKK